MTPINSQESVRRRENNQLFLTLSVDDGCDLLHPAMALSLATKRLLSVAFSTPNNFLRNTYVLTDILSAQFRLQQKMYICHLQWSESHQAGIKAESQDGPNDSRFA